ncbi:trigger factor domain-containing protein [Natranaerobius thermophilus]|uniref:Trigger factor domain protein n=1 Tax=Natranaerobius thermophilus (strain ATCC BAA-1301 / DSM 18059 / JW/NM-WN-LF) TaxID=457570 RepID=B2A8G4_NATTJ|nr:trigger factor domain-containing protein [Natranaerobius thermophilus]ACB85848.1 trigger factor domain protein [Natranaerobius thermophilus JW/NM-WN-LF]
MKYKGYDISIKLGDYRKICKQIGCQEDYQNSQHQILESILNDSQIKIPRELTLQEANDMLKDMEKQIRYHGKNLFEYLQEQDKSINEFKEELAEQAEYRLKVELLLIKIAEQEDISATTEELDEEINQLARENQIPFEAAKEKVTLQGAQSKLERKIMLEKTADFLLNLARS